MNEKDTIILKKIDELELEFGLPSGSIVYVGSKDPEIVIQQVCRNFGITKDQLLSNQRGQRFFMARKTIAKILRKDHGLSFPDIGIILNRDHSSIIHMVR